MNIAISNCFLFLQNVRSHHLVVVTANTANLKQILSNQKGTEQHLQHTN